jgi:hypothetical protein
MIYNLLTLFLSFLLIISITFRANNKLLLLLVIYCIFIFFTLSFNTQNQDYLDYVEIFNNSGARIEIGYLYLVESLKYVGFTSHFSVLLTLSMLIVLTLVRLNRYSPYLPAVLIFYLMFLFPVDVIQIRNTFVVFIILNAILFLHEKRYFSFGLLSFIAITFHYIAIVYIVTICASFSLRGKNAYLLILLSLVVSFFLINFALGATAFTKEFGSLAHYITKGKISSVLIWGSSVIFFILVVKFFIFKSIASLKNKSPNVDFAYFIYTIILASLIFLPGLYFLFEFNRVYRFILMLILIFMGTVFGYIPIKNRLYIYIYLICMFSFFGFYYSNMIDFDWVLFGAERSPLPSTS